MNIYIKEISVDDDKKYFDLLIELANYENSYAKPVPEDFEYQEFQSFKETRVKMGMEDYISPKYVRTTTFWVMDGDLPVGYATLKHELKENTIGGHFGLCLKREYQNKGIGTYISELLSKCAYELGIEKVIYTAKKENIQSQKNINKIGAVYFKEDDKYYYYEDDLTKKYGIERKR